MKFKSNAKYDEEPKTGRIFATNTSAVEIRCFSTVVHWVFTTTISEQRILRKLSVKQKKLSCVKLRKSERIHTYSIQTTILNLTDIRRTQ